MAADLLEVRGLTTYFYTRAGVAKAVDGVSFSLKAGETLGLVGESGSGKSVTCLSILRLVPEPAGKIVAGEVIFEGSNLLAKSEAEMRRIRGRKISIVLQDPMTSLNPVLSIGDQVTETIRLHQKLKGQSLWDKAKDILRLVRIPSPEIRLRNFPHQLSGGMRQRVSGAISLSCEPRLLIADEPTTSLDVTIQAQYLALLKDIQAQTGLAMIFVTHDFGIVARMCDTVAVMYAGRIVEIAALREIFAHPQHPYSIALMKSVPRVEKRVDRLTGIGGQPPSLFALPLGCSFSPRCGSRTEKCEQVAPPSVAVGADHRVSCWLCA